MAIENNQPLCDACGEYGPKEESWWDAKYKADELGWLSQKMCGEWFNYCPNCRKDYEE